VIGSRPTRGFAVSCGPNVHRRSIEREEARVVIRWLTTSGIVLFGTAWLTACGGDRDPAESAAGQSTTLDQIAEQYVRTALAFRAYDDSYVDAYYGPAEWSSAAEARGATLDELREEAGDTLARLETVDVGDEPAIVQARKNGLEKTLRSMLLRMDMAAGARVPFDEESRTLFDAVAPAVEERDLRGGVAEIDALVPGEGSLTDRVDAFRNGFTIPVERLAAVFDAAIAECRRRTLERIALPADESFTLEYVTDQPWSGYNWYQGNGHSLIQINTDLPIYIDRAVDLGCHEGYPGHHTYNALLEEALVEERGWIEFTLAPLYGPTSLISEGSANYGIELAFPDAERRAFEKEVLFPLAGLSVAQADHYHDLRDALERLRYAEIAAARDYLDGAKTSVETIAWLRELALVSEERAAQRIRFFDAYRSYIINYSFGRDLIEAYLTKQAGEGLDGQWAAFEQLLSMPTSPSELQ
jgi:hypothetical protein